MRMTRKASGPGGPKRSDPEGPRTDDAEQSGRGVGERPRKGRRVPVQGECTSRRFIVVLFAKNRAEEAPRGEGAVSATRANTRRALGSRAALAASMVNKRAAGIRHRHTLPGPIQARARACVFRPARWWCMQSAIIVVADVFPFGPRALQFTDSRSTLESSRAVPARKYEGGTLWATMFAVMPALSRGMRS